MSDMNNSQKASTEIEKLQLDKRKLVLDIFTRLLIAVITVIVPIIIAQQINSTQKMKEVVELYNLINNEQDFKIKKEFLRLWASLNPGDKVEGTIEQLLVSIESEAKALAENSAEAVKLMNSINTQLSASSGLSVDQINTLNTGFSEYYRGQSGLIDSLAAPGSLENYLPPPVYIEKKDVPQITDFVEKNLSTADEKTQREFIRRYPSLVPKDRFIKPENNLKLPQWEPEGR